MNGTMSENRKNNIETDDGDVSGLFARKACKIAAICMAVQNPGMKNSTRDGKC